MQYFKGIVAMGLVMLLAVGLRAQQPAHCDCFVKGTVKDRETRQPVVGAVLQIRGTTILATTDADGRYQFTKLCQGDYVIECRIVGYKTIHTRISLQHSAEENLNLSEEEVHLHDVEITAKRVVLLTQKPTTLTPEELDNTRGQVLAEALKSISGVWALQTGATISKPVIRGLHSNRVLVMNNGLRQEGQQWGSEHAPEIDPFIAKSVSVIKGAAGVRYGSDAIGGVVLVEPAALPAQKGLNGEINAVGFSNGRAGIVSGTLEGGMGRLQGWGWRLQGTLKNSGNLRTPDYFLANTGVREQNFSIATGYRNERRGAEIFFSRFDSTVGIFAGAHIGSTTDLLNVIKNGEPFVKSDFVRQIDRPKQDITHNLLKIKLFRVIKGNRLSLTAGRQVNARQEWDLHGPQAALQPALSFKISTYSTDLAWEHKPTLQRLSGQMGLSTQYQYNTTEGRPLIPNFEQLNLGIFVIERLLRDKWEYEAGIRFDKRWLWVSRFGTTIPSPQTLAFNNFSGSIGTVYNASEVISLRFNFGTAWRPPNINELYSRGVHHGAAAYEEGDVGLRPEVAFNTQGSLEFKGNKLKIELDFYHNLIQKYIYAKPQPEPILTIRGAFPYFKYTQTDATFSGIDLNSTLTLLPRLQHHAKLSYLRAYDQTNQDFLVLIPANRFENSLQWEIGNVWRLVNTQFMINHLWVDKQRRFPSNSDFMIPPAAYHIWSLNVSGQIPLAVKQHLQWTVSVQNLLDTAYRDYLNRFRYFAHEQGRNLSLKLKYNF